MAKLALAQQFAHTSGAAADMPVKAQPEPP
jgi:hypothetical protein